MNATDAHLPQVMEIEREAISPPWSEGALLNEVGRDDGLFILATDDGTADPADAAVAGFCILRRCADEAELYQIAVRADFRQRGVGGRLMEEALRYCRMRGIVSVYLEVRRSNNAAIGLYKKHGFKNEGRRKNYYSSPVEDAVIMSHMISAQ